MQAPGDGDLKPAPLATTRTEVHHPPSYYESYRTNRVRSLFNVDSAKSGFDLVADVPTWEGDWRIGAVFGPSGSGKTSIGRVLVETGSDVQWVDPWNADWPDVPVIDAVGGDYHAATGALAAVGLGTVPSWLRPYSVLSNGEQFRAEMAKLTLERPKQVVLDEFTSVLDRQVARVAALAFAKTWRRDATGQVVVLTPHRDVLEWLRPDWVLETADAGSGGKATLHGSEWVQSPPANPHGDPANYVGVLEV